MAATPLSKSWHLASIASGVTLVHRRDKFRPTQLLIDKVMEKVAAGKDRAGTRLTHRTGWRATPPA